MAKASFGRSDAEIRRDLFWLAKMEMEQREGMRYHLTLGWDGVGGRTGMAWVL